MDLSTFFSNETLALITPPLISAVLTIFYALEGWKKSGENFNVEKFATTMGTEIITIIVIAGICFGFDLTAYPAILAFAPTIATILITQAVSWYNKTITPPPEPIETPPPFTPRPLPQVHTINIVITTPDQQPIIVKTEPLQTRNVTR